MKCSDKEQMHILTDKTHEEWCAYDVESKKGCTCGLNHRRWCALLKESNKECTCGEPLAICSECESISMSDSKIKE